MSECHHILRLRDQVKTQIQIQLLNFLTCLHNREFFGQGWMKNDKNEKTPYIMRTTKHFNDVCYNKQTLFAQLEF